ncbi:MAG: hypothetical protein WCD79_02095 [Chthoniobacteraceae bacterium]
MPHVINGIGTWHWGKRNIYKETGTCEFCNAFGELRSYDTTLFFVVVFVPLIPIKQERVLRSCPRCRKFRVMKLKTWNEAKQKDILAAVEALKTDSRNPENVSRAIRTVVGYQDEAAFLRLAAVVREHGDSDPQLQGLLGAAYVCFLHFPEAEECYRASLRGKDDPAVREDLARCLMKQLRPDEARPLLEHIFTGQEGMKTGLIALLVEAFQNVGKHAEALQLLDRMRQVFPQIAAQKNFQKYGKVSKKNLSSGKIIRSPHLVIPKKGAMDRAGWRFSVPRFIALGILLLAVGGYLASCFSTGLSREVHLVNGLDKAYEIEVGGRHLKVLPRSDQVIQVHEGAVPVHISTPGINIPDRSFTISTPFLIRPFLHKTFVINPDACALLLREEISYYPESSAAAHDNDKNPYQLSIGQDFYAFDGIDYPFQQAPHNITMSEHDSRTVKTSLTLVREPSLEHIANFIFKELGNEKTSDYFQHYLAVNPGDISTVLPILEAVSDAKSLAGFLRPKLQDRPVMLQVHRVYQNLVLTIQPDNNGLEAEYREALAKDPSNSALMYLTARLLHDSPEAVKLFNQAAAAKDPCPYASFALAYDQVAGAHYSKGLDLIEKALSLQPGDTTFEHIEIDALAGLGNIDRLLEINAALRAESPLDGDLVADQIMLSVQKGDGDEVVKRAGDEFIRHLGASATPGDAKLWRVYFDGVAAYAHGDQAGYGDALAKMPGDSNAFQSAFCLGKYQDAAAVLDKNKKADPSLRLLVYIAAQHEGNTALADRQLQAAIAALEKSGEIERKSAAWLKDGSNLSPDEVTSLKTSIQEKRILLTAIGVRYTKLQEPCFQFAAQLNRDPHFPSPFLKSIVGSAPANLVGNQKIP